MIVNVNGWPGAGKLTVASHLVILLNARLIDNHQFIDLASIVEERGTTSYYSTVRKLRQIIFQRVLELPSSQPIVLTNVVVHPTKSGFSEENWFAVQNLAAQRQCHLFAVRLTPSIEENERRLVLEERNPQKMRHVAELAEARSQLGLFDDGATAFLEIDNTHMEASACASKIADWLANAA